MIMRPTSNYRDTNSVEVYRVEELNHEEVDRGLRFRILKRAVDIVSAILALIFMCIITPIISLAIKIDSTGPVFYRQERLGKDGKSFMMIKFRSMRVDAEANGAQWAQENDDRVTRVGRILRKTRLDEMPQFFNVLKGDMSLIGPRPERPIFYKEFEAYISGFHQRLCVRPGLSGFAQVAGGYDLAPQEKILYDIEYIKRRSARFDMLITLKTFAVLLNHRGAR